MMLVSELVVRMLLDIGQYLFKYDIDLNFIRWVGGR